MRKTTLGSVVPEPSTYYLHESFRSSQRGPFKARADRKRLRITDPTSDKYLGPWAGFEDEQVKIKRTQDIEVTVEELVQPLPPCEASNDETMSLQYAGTSSIFHGQAMCDYQGRSWTSYNKSSGKSSTSTVVTCALPKKSVKCWRGHSMGVQTIKLFPKSAHLLLSASMDSTLRMWKIYGDRECMMTYRGHSHAVRDAVFAFGGDKFYSVSFDCNVHLWDTETGKVISRFASDKVNYCIAVHPHDNKSFVVGNANHKALQYDAASGKLTQEYNEHLGPVSSVTFCEDGKKLLTTSDDRKVFVWNYGIPVVDKYISDSSFHAVPAVTLDPTGSFFAGQAMNNSIIVNQATGEYKYQGNKKFRGHQSSGYAIRPEFSTDGKYIASGSSDGRVFFWDWKTTKLYRSFKAHEGVCMSLVWHPSHPSRFISCGWDSTIKLWE